MTIAPVQALATLTYESASREFDDFCTWLDAVGISYSITRVGKYRSIFQALAAAQKAESMNGFYKKYSRMDYYNAVVERAQLMRISDGLRGVNDYDIVERLKKAVRSHELFVLDTENRSGRDFSLELDIAAKFARSGYSLDFAHDADVSALKDGLNLFVECKRLKSEAHVRDNIKKGLKQLKNRYKASSASANMIRGLLVLSIGKVINPEFGYMEGTDITSIGDDCARLVNAFVARYSRYWLYEQADQRSLGVAIVLDAPGVPRSTDKPIVYSIHEVVVTNIVQSSSPEHALLEQIAVVFAPRSSLKIADKLTISDGEQFNTPLPVELARPADLY